MASLILIVILITTVGEMITQPSFGAEIGLEILVVINTVLVKLLVGHALCLFKSFCRGASGFSSSEPPPTPGPFAVGLSRNEGTIPGIGVAMPLSMLQGSATQMPQAHMMGINQMNPGSVTSSNIPPAIGGFANPMANIQGASTSGLQNFQIGGVFNLPQGGQMAPIPGLNAYQPGMMDVRVPGMALGGNIGMPPPPPPTMPHGSAPQ
ncbi:hypothetical protein GW17_00016153 [Ensete ventricosum]|nr:hypothetical protein GW17_00016153 [Ensete ventricosum]